MVEEFEKQNAEGLSVLICAYSRDLAEHVETALSSIVNQTFAASEIIFVLDGPVSIEVEGVIEKYSKKARIELVRLDSNQGLRAALNVGLQHCNFDLIARMDADDEALPHRFARQVSFMQLHPHVAVCSSWIEERDDMTVPGRIKTLPTENSDLIKFAKMRSPINHPAAIFRKGKVLEVGGYPKYFPEDYALWSLMLSKGMIFANIGEVLLYMRVGKQFFSRRGRAFLKGELGLILFQVRIGFLTVQQGLRSAAVRLVLRSSPSFLRRLFYAIFR